MMELTAIIFRLFAWARPLLWYYHKLGYFLRIAIRYVADEACLTRLIEHPDLRAWVEGMLVDAERCCDIAIALRTRELLGLPMPQGRLGIGGFHRIHSPP
ncbi:MAG TPA: hypothetical protein VFV70_15900, partial [Hyphomonadaceae bacterium]|nr:hypothetical protein [Hyphomonadaceae bacterium]